MVKGNHKRQLRLSQASICFFLGVLATISIVLPYIYIERNKKTPYFRDVERLVRELDARSQHDQQILEPVIEISHEPLLKHVEPLLKHVSLKHEPLPLQHEPLPLQHEPLKHVVVPELSKHVLIAAEIRTGMQRAFQAYMRDAWKADEYMPVQKRGTNTFGGKGLTIIDSLDTLYLMGLHEEFGRARNFVANDFHFRGHINVFENTIRVLGGLLSAYSLTKDELFLTNAKMVGEVLLTAFPQRIPCGVIDTNRHGYCGAQSWSGGKSVNAEVGTLAVEFVALSKFTGDARWSDKIHAINRYWREHDHELLRMNIDPKSERMTGPATIGGGIDSTYEYLIKLRQLTGDRLAGELYNTFEKMIVEQMFVTYGETTFARAAGSDELEHLGCFLGGMLIMGNKYVQQGLAMTETCARMYTTNPSGIACDKARIQRDGSIHCVNDIYLLRPEVVESIFYAWRETHDQKWRNYARDIWRAIAKHCQVDSGGFTDVRRVTSVTPVKMDKQESWFLAETLKYLWLTFQPDSVIPLDKYVFNTEAHPIEKF